MRVFLITTLLGTANGKVGMGLHTCVLHYDCGRVFENGGVKIVAWCKHDCMQSFPGQSLNVRECGLCIEHQSTASSHAQLALCCLYCFFLCELLVFYCHPQNESLDYRYFFYPK